MSRPGFNSVRLYDSFTTNTLSETIAAPVFPPLQQGNVTASSALRTASWFFVGDASSVADAVIMKANWNHVISGTNNQSQWYFIMPPDSQGVTFPKLPAQFEANLPAASDGLNGQVAAFDSPSINGYDGARAQPSRNLMCLQCSARNGDYQRVIVSGGTIQ